MSTSRAILWSVLLASLSSAAFPCENPPLAPAVPDPGGLSREQRQAVEQDVTAYYEAMKVYTACLEAEIVAARGDDAPRYRAELIDRNNAAVAEAETVLEALEAYVPLPANPASEAALRRTIDEWIAAKPNYDLMTPEVQRTDFRRAVSSFGKFESMTFLSTNSLGADVFLVGFADGVMIWEIGLTSDGKTSRSAIHVCRQNGMLVDPRSVPRCRPPPPPPQDHNER